MAHAAIVGTGTPVRQWGEDLFEQKRGVIFRGEKMRTKKTAPNTGVYFFVFVKSVKLLQHG